MTKRAVAFALCTLLAACAEVPLQTANANTPGFTGTTILRGSTSTVADLAKVTYQQQKWGYSPAK